MQKYYCNNIKWANKGDLNLPFWCKIANRANSKLQNWILGYIGINIPLFESPTIIYDDNTQDLAGKVFEISENAKLVHIDDIDKEESFKYGVLLQSKDIKEIDKVINKVTYRLVSILHFSDNNYLSNFDKNYLIEKNIEISSLPADSVYENQSVRTLGFVLDADEDIKTVGILIPHYQSYTFLKTCLNYIEKYKNKNIKETIYVLDDLSKDGSLEKLKEEFKDKKNIIFTQIKRYNKEKTIDVGLVLDEGIKLIKEQYVAMIDSDTFILNNNWASLPISLIKKYALSSIGADTGLSSSYNSEIAGITWMQPRTGYTPRAGIYDNEWFTCTNNFYRVMNSATAKIVAKKIGFSMAVLDKDLKLRIMRRISRIPILCNLLNRPFWQKLYNKRYPYLPGGEDNDVAANHFMDINRMGPKFNIPLTSYIGLTPKDGAFGQNIAGLVFHFALSTRALSLERREVEDAGEEFQYWVGKLKEANGVNEDILKEMIEKSKVFRAGGYHGEYPVSIYKEDYDTIQRLIKESENL